MSSPQFVSRLRLKPICAMLALLTLFSPTGSAFVPEPWVVLVYYPMSYKAKLRPAAPASLKFMSERGLADASPRPPWLREPGSAVDLTAVIQEHLSCVLRERGVCIPVVVVDQVGSDPAVAASPKNVLELRFNGSSEGFLVVLDFDGADPDGGPEVRRKVSLRHASPDCNGMTGDPMRYYALVVPDARAQKLQQCWFAASPTRFEGLVGTSLDRMAAELRQQQRVP